MAAKGIQLLVHPPNLRDLVLADFFLFRRVKEALAGITLDQESLRMPWKRLPGTSPPVTAFWRWFERAKPKNASRLC
jgi:hypothetical protein